MAELSTLSILGSAYADAIDSYGCDSDALFAQAGLSKDLISTPGGRFPWRRELELWRLAVEATGDPCFGLTAAQHIKPASFHALGMAWLTSPSLSDALQRLVRYCKVISTALCLELAEEDDRCRVDISRVHNIEVPGQCVDGLCAAIALFCRWLHDDTLSPILIEVEHEQFEPVEHYYELFRAEVLFDAPRDAIHFDRAQLNATVPSGDPRLARANEEIAADYLESLGIKRVSARCCKALRDLLPAGDASIKAVAEHLCLSVSTLQRQLRTESTSYSELLEDMRLSMATDYLSDKELSLAEVTYLLGFSDQSNFSKAFRRWTGRSPGEYRG